MNRKTNYKDTKLLFIGVIIVYAILIYIMKVS